MRRLALVAVAASLCACQPQADDTAIEPPPTAPPPANQAETPAPEPAGSPVAHGPADDFHAPLRVIGTEPFWAVLIGEKITVQRPSEPDLVVANAGPTVNGDVAVWNARDLTIRLEAQPGCSDGMSDNRYPYAATVTLNGQVLKGCAAREDQWPREGAG